MIQTSKDVLLHFGGSPGEDRTLQCDVIFGQMIDGETDERLDYLMYEYHHARRRTLKCRSFFLTAEDGFWLASFLKATDKTITVNETEEFSVVNRQGNLDKIFDLIKGSNVRADLELKFNEVIQA